MAIEQLFLFDLDADLLEDPATKDFYELYGVDAVNQSIDIFIMNPYRIGKGLTNLLFQSVFVDIKYETEESIAQIIQSAFEDDYPFVELNEVIVNSMPNERRIKVTLKWTLNIADIQGVYTRYWSTKS